MSLKDIKDISIKFILSNFFFANFILYFIMITIGLDLKEFFITKDKSYRCLVNLKGYFNFKLVL